MLTRNCVSACLFTVSLLGLTLTFFTLRLQTHCRLRSHHVRVCLALPQGLPTRRQGRCRRGSGVPTQVRYHLLVFDIHVCSTRYK